MGEVTAALLPPRPRMASPDVSLSSPSAPSTSPVAALGYRSVLASRSYTSLAQRETADTNEIVSGDGLLAGGGRNHSVRFIL